MKFVMVCMASWPCHGGEKKVFEVELEVEDGQTLDPSLAQPESRRQMMEALPLDCQVCGELPSLAMFVNGQEMGVFASPDLIPFAAGGTPITVRMKIMETREHAIEALIKDFGYTREAAVAEIRRIKGTVIARRELRRQEGVRDDQ